MVRSDSLQSKVNLSGLKSAVARYSRKWKRASAAKKIPNCGGCLLGSQSTANNRPPPQTSPSRNPYVDIFWGVFSPSNSRILSSRGDLCGGKASGSARDGRISRMVSWLRFVVLLVRRIPSSPSLSSLCRIACRCLALSEDVILVCESGQAHYRLSNSRSRNGKSLHVQHFFLSSNAAGSVRLAH